MKWLWPIILVLLGGVVFYFIGALSHGYQTTPVDATQILGEASRKLYHYYSRGDLLGNWENGGINCPQDLVYNPSVDRSFLQCNPEYLDCLLKGGVKGLDSRISVKRGEVIYQVFANIVDSKNQKYYEYYPQKLIAGHKVKDVIRLSLSIKGFRGKYDFIFENNCRDVFLPKRKYGHGPFNSKESFEWSQDLQLFVDKRPVTYQDILLNKRVLKNESKLSLSVSDYGKYALGLSKNEMHKYCLSLGKQVIQSHVYDGMSFFPWNESQTHPPIVMRGPYPWNSQRKKNLDQLIRLKPEKYCKKVFTKECQRIMKYIFYDSNSLTWMGAFDVLGGFMEYIENPMYPRQNLRVSSRLLAASDRWHEIGRRGFWGGDERSARDFPFLSSLPAKDLEGPLAITFRCMGYYP